MDTEEIKHKIATKVVKNAFAQGTAPKYDFSVEDAIDTLFKILHHKTGDLSIDSVGDDIISGLSDYFERGVNITNLACSCEPFARLILYLVNPEAYQSSKSKQSALYDVLIDLKFGTKETLDKNKTVEDVCDKMFFAEHIDRFYHARNKVHFAPVYSLTEEGLIFESLCVFLVYAVSQYRQQIEAVLRNMPRIEHLKNMRDRYQKWGPRYVEIDGQERISQYFEWMEPSAEEELNEDAIDGQGSRNDDLEEELFDQKRKGKVLDLIDQVPHAIFLGEAGAGKTTTMQYLAWQRADKLVKEPTNNLPYPVYVALKLCATDHTLKQSINEELEQSKEETEFLDGNYILLLDGLNEVRKSCLEEVNRDIELILNRGKQTKIVITTRKADYHNQFDVPAFNLQALTDEQIISFIEKRFSDPLKKDQFIAVLKKDPKLWQWGRNPLCLGMITDIGLKTGGDIPDNKGRLMQLFVRNLMQREKTQHAGMCTDYETKENLLSFLAFETLNDNGQIAFSYYNAATILKNASARLGSMIDIPLFIEEVIDNDLLTKAGERILSFKHEMYQEYFAACEIFIRQAKNPVFRDTLTDTIWDEPKILYSGLTVDREEFTNSLVKKRPHLAAKCYTSSTKDEPSIRMNIEEAAAEAAQNTSSPVVMKENLQALIELGAVERFVNIIKSAKTFSKEHRQIIEEFVATRSPEDALMLIKLIEISGPSRMAVRWIVDALMNKSFQPYETERAMQIAKDLLSLKWSYEAGALHSLFTIPDTLIITVDMLLKSRSLIGLNMAIDLIKQNGLEDQFPRGEVEDELVKMIKNLIDIRKGVRKAKLHRAIDQIKKHGLEGRISIENIISKLLKSGKIPYIFIAADIIIQYHYETLFPLENIVNMLFGSNDIKSLTKAFDMYKNNNLEERLPIENIISGLLEVSNLKRYEDTLNRINFAYDLIHQYKREDKHPSKENLIYALNEKVGNPYRQLQIGRANLCVGSFHERHYDNIQAESKEKFAIHAIQDKQERQIIAEKLKNTIFNVKIETLTSNLAGTYLGFAIHPQFLEHIYLPPNVLRDQTFTVGDIAQARVSIGLDKKMGGRFTFVVSKIHKDIINLTSSTQSTKNAQAIVNVSDMTKETDEDQGN